MNAHVSAQGLNFRPVINARVAVSFVAAVEAPTARFGWAIDPPLPAGFSNRPLTMREIAARVAERHNLTVDDLRGRGRSRDVAWPRQEAMWLMRCVLRPDGSHRYSLPQIGQFLGHRDHTTILDGCRRHQARLDERKAASS